MTSHIQFSPATTSLFQQLALGKIIYQRATLLRMYLTVKHLAPFLNKSPPYKCSLLPQRCYKILVLMFHLHRIVLQRNRVYLLYHRLPFQYRPATYSLGGINCFSSVINTTFKWVCLCCAYPHCSHQLVSSQKFQLLLFLLHALP